MKQKSGPQHVVVFRSQFPFQQRKCSLALLHNCPNMWIIFFFFHLVWSLNSYLITSRRSHLCTSTSRLIPARRDLYQSASAGKVGMFGSVQILDSATYHSDSDRTEAATIYWLIHFLSIMKCITNYFENRSLSLRTFSRNMLLECEYFMVLFPPLRQWTEYLCVVDKSRDLRASYRALGNTKQHFSLFIWQNDRQINQQ